MPRASKRKTAAPPSSQSVKSPGTFLVPCFFMSCLCFDAREKVGSGAAIDGLSKFLVEGLDCFRNWVLCFWSLALLFLSGTRSSGAAIGKAKSKDRDKIDHFFDSYANSSSGLIEPEGIEALCSDLGVDYTDVRILMFAWKLKAERQGYFTSNEWWEGLKALKVDNLSKLKKVLPELEKEVEESFDDFYAYAFRYCLTEEKQKTVDIETICELLKLVLGSKFPSQFGSLVRYLKIQSDYKVINLDQWVGFLRFCKEISFPDLENYDSNQAWPLILDSFVEWMKEKQS